MTTLLVILGIWLGLGLLAEIMGIVYAKHFNGIKSALILIGLGGISLVLISKDIYNGYDYNRYESDVKTFKTYNGMLLEEGKKYSWNGHSVEQNHDYKWTNFKCKIKKISEGKITIYDYQDKKEYVFTGDSLEKNKCEFILFKKI